VYNVLQGGLSCNASRIKKTANKITSGKEQQMSGHVYWWYPRG